MPTILASNNLLMMLLRSAISEAAEYEGNIIYRISTKGNDTSSLQNIFINVHLFIQQTFTKVSNTCQTFCYMGRQKMNWHLWSLCQKGFYK